MSFPSSSTSPMNNSNPPSPEEIQRQIHQFNRLLWTPSLSQATSLLTTYPQLLSTPNKIDFLPIHTAIKSTRSPYRSQIIKLIIEKGIENEIGGPNARGGLLLHCKDKFSRNALSLLVVGDDKTDVLNYLQNTKPHPLLTAQDVVDYCLLHAAATDPFYFKDRYVTFRYLIDLCPEGLRCKNDYDDLPIHHLCKQPGYSIDVLKLYLNEMLHHGIDVECDGDGTPFLECCLDDHVLPLLESVDRDDVPILHAVIGVVEQNLLRTVIDTFPFFSSWCCVRDGRGRLPMHVAVECGLHWMDGMKEIVEANMSAISVIDPISGLYPFQMAACSNYSSNNNMNMSICSSDGDEESENGISDGSCDLNVIFTLARYEPSCIQKCVIPTYNN